MKKKIKVLVLCVAVVLGVVLIARAYLDMDPVKTQYTVVFSDPASLNTAAYTLDSIRSTEDLMFLETKPAEVVNAANGMEYPLTLVSFENGAATYTFESAEESINADDLNASASVLYVEEKVDESVSISLSSSELISVTVSDSKERFPDAEQGVLVEFVAQNVESVPYDLVLVSGGEVYDECSVSYYFDNETGNFKDAYMVYFGITLDELSADAYLETTSMFNRYVLSEISLAE